MILQAPNERRLALALAAALVVAGCDEPGIIHGASTGAGGGAGATRAGDPASTPASQDRKAVPTNVGDAPDTEVERAMHCWGLTHGSYFLHQASPQTAADLPKASSQDYRSWANQAATLIKARGGTLAEYDALKRRFQTTLTSARERREVVAALQTCIDTVPRHMLDVEQPILTEPG